MPLVLVPVRYPLTDHSRATLAQAIREAEERAASLCVLHVNLYQSGHRVRRSALKEAVESEFGHIPNTQYVVRPGLLVEETILEEAAAQKADAVVIGKKQVGRWRSMIRRITDDADVERFLREQLESDVVTATYQGS